MISAVALEISVLFEQSGEINEEASDEAFRRQDALRALLNKAGVTPRGLPSEPVTLTEADHPNLALKALETQYRKRLSRTEDTESMGFTAPTEPLVELGRLVAAFRERLDYAPRDDQSA